MSLGDYEILGEMARRGMSITCRARRRQTGRLVQIEIFRLGWEGELPFEPGGHRDRYLARLAVLALLEHPNILPTLEVGEDATALYTVHPLIEGVHLDRIAFRAAPEPQRAAHLVMQLACATEYLHAHGIYHRDIAPARVLVGGETPYLLGFDCAHVRFLYPPLEPEPAGAIIGTPAFLAPEVARGEGRGADPGVDVWGLGALLYVLVTGRPPFQGTSVVETLMATLEREPPAPRSLNPEVEPDLEMICLKCLQKEPGRRYRSAQDMADDLRRFLAGEPIGPPAPTSLAGRLRDWMRSWLGRG